MNWFEEFLTILSYSKKTQWAIILGLISCVCIILLGEYMLSNFELHGSMKAMGPSVANAFLKFYGIYALGALVLSLKYAAKFYVKDKERLWK